MVTPAKRVAAAQLIKTGEAISLSREFPKHPAPNNPTPAHHFMRRNQRGSTAGSAVDYYEIAYHGQATTHLEHFVMSGIKTECGTAEIQTM